jgi:hypothetical protein
MVYINENGGVRVGVRITAQQLETATYLLDSYGGAAAAYSLRKLNSTYVGSAIRVRRSGDNLEGNIGFDASGNLDTASLLSFIGVNNTALYSEELDNASWSKGAITVTTNQTTAPDGTMTADLVSETATSINHGIAPNYTSVSFPTGTSWNMSVYVKKGPGASAPNTFALSFNIGGTSVTADPLVLFSFSTGGAIETYNPNNDANFGYSMESVGDGWFRCAMWGTLTITENRVKCGGLRFNNNLNTLTTAYYTGNTQSNMYIWGWQFLRSLNNTSVLTTKPYTKTTSTEAGNGFVTTWYDQSGNGRHATQSTATSQPKIVINAVLNTLGNKAAINFDGSGDSLNFPYNQGSTNEMYLVTQTSDTYFVYPTNALSTYGYVAQNGSTSTALYSNYGTPQLFTNGILKNPVNRGDVYNILNGYKLVNNKNFSMSAWTSYPTIIGVYSGSADYNGNVQEWLIYPTLQGSQSQIESNINNYYSLWDSSIVQSGLVMNLDAGFKSSYLGSGTTWYDISGYGNNNGTMFNSVGYTASNGGGLTFNGTNQYVDFGQNKFKVENFTMEVVFKIDQLPTVGGNCNTPQYGIIGQKDWGYTLRMWGDGKASFRVSDTNGSEITIKTQNSVVGSRCHITVKKSGTSIYIYLNGVLQSSGNMATGSIRWNATTWPFQIGNSECGSFSHYLNGTINLARFYTTVLTDSEILQNFNATKSRFGL